MPAGPVNINLLSTTAASTSRAWTYVGNLESAFTIIIIALESGGAVEVWMSNLLAPPTSMPVAGDGTVQWGADVTVDTICEVSATYRWISVIKKTAGGSPTKTSADLSALARA